MNFTPFPEIKTDRLLLRKLQASDCEVILFLRTDKNVTKFIERPEHRKTKNISEAIELIKELESYIERNTSIVWGITLKMNPQSSERFVCGILRKTTISRRSVMI